MKPLSTKTEQKNPELQVETDANSESAEVEKTSQDDLTSVYFLRILLSVSAFVLSHLFEDYLALNDWGGVAFFIGIIGAWIYASFKTKFFGSETERRIGDFLYTLIPWAILAMIIFAVLARYFTDRHLP
jgi:Na+/glutamate symporter